MTLNRQQLTNTSLSRKGHNYDMETVLAESTNY